MKRFLPLFLLLPGMPSLAAFAVANNQIQEHADGVLALMSYSVVPDITTSSLSIDNAKSGDPGLTMTQFGGGFTFSRDVPLYLEGTAAASRYDPTFVASDGQESRPVPVKWTTVSATGGVGWDFTLAEDLYLRPMVNISLGYVTSDLNIFKWWLDDNSDANLDALDGGTMNATGIGGSLMLDYEDYAPSRDIDVELRYTNIRLRSHSDFDTVIAEASAETSSLWARYRAPTGIEFFDRPFRYVLEAAHTTYLGSQAGVLGFNHMSSLGSGIEFDTSAYDIIISRTRLVLRYAFGQDISGYSVGLAVSF